MRKIKEIEIVKAKLGVRDSQDKYIKWLKGEIKDLSTQRKLYTRQSEWHKLMYAKTFELEIMERKRDGA